MARTDSIVAAWEAGIVDRVEVRGSRVAHFAAKGSHVTVCNYATNGRLPRRGIGTCPRCLTFWTVDYNGIRSDTIKRHEARHAS